MRILVQRVSRATVVVEKKKKCNIGCGLVVLLGIETEDEQSDADWLIRKLTGLRIFEDEQSHMNRCLADVSGELVVISQFTLHASTKKGNRPSFIKAARPEQAIPLYEYFIRNLETFAGTRVCTGEFGAHMDIELVNDGPVTIMIDSKRRE